MDTPSFLKNAGLSVLLLTGLWITSCDHAKIRSAPSSGDDRAPSSKKEASATQACTVCLENVSDKDIAAHEAYVCDHHHCIDRECLGHQVNSLANVKDLESKGLPCCGYKCKDRISLTTIRDFLNPEDRAALDVRLAKASTPSQDQNSHPQTQTDTQKLSQGIEEAFNLCCPKEGCGAVLDEIEGCNAATCSNEECKGRFCYLCLKPQWGYISSHTHLIKHSGDFWERRPGFTARYHWLIARKKLAHLFEKRFKWYQRIFSNKDHSKNKVDDSVRISVLESKKALLEENNFWPMPAGLDSNQWIQEVRNAELPENKNLEILQNEYIYRRQTGDKKNANIIKAELMRLNLPIIASLDVKDVPRGSDWAAIQRADIIPVMNEDARVTRKFAELGNMYEVEGLIWSGVPKEKMTSRVAGRFCKDLGGGSRLPSREEYETLARAMGHPHQYNPNLLPDMRGNWFWTSTTIPPEELKYSTEKLRFYGNDAEISWSYTLALPATGRVRCVKRGRIRDE